jgi:nitrate/nitrite-specific signal transduction histidine kinase
LLGWGYLIVRREIIRPSSIMAVARNGRDYVLPEGNGQARSRSSRFREMFRPEFENARELLENIVDQRTRELITAFEFSQEIVRQPDPGRLMNLVTEKAQTLLAADSSAVCLIEPEGATLQLMAVRGEVAARIELPESSYDQEPIQVVSQGPPAYSSEACANCAFFKAVDSPNTISVPFVSGEQKLGTLCMARGAERPFSGDDRRALSLLANSAAIAISNVRLAEENQLRVRQAAVRDERDRLTAELHDNLAQTLAYLTITTNRVQDMLTDSENAAALTELEGLKSGADTAYTQVRSALSDLRRPPPSSIAFAQELAALVAVFRETSGVSTELITSESGAEELPELVQQQGLYIVREALMNVRRHAAASSVVIRVTDVGEEVHITVEDDGRGFDPAVASRETHLGLTIMQARAERCGGVLTVASAPGEGAQISARLPKERPGRTIRLELVS